MKQFIVDRHTTPNTPTLEQVPTEKLPIYEDADAVTADLANLAEGQIVATKDEGSELSAPVDVIQDGNMHAATSNAVARALTPSIETLLNENMLTSQEYQIDSEDYDFLYIDVDPDNSYHYTLFIPCAVLTTTYAQYWLTGFYQNTASNYYIALGLKKDSVKVSFIQKDGSSLSQLNNVKIYGQRFNNR